MFSAAAPAQAAVATARDVKKHFFHVSASVARDQVFRRSLVNDKARAQHDDVVAHPLDLAHVVRREQHRASAFPLIVLEIRAHPVADSGSSDAVGSSSSNTSGWLRSALASETRVRWPAERLP